MLLFGILGSAGFFALSWVKEHATSAQSGSAQVISGKDALWRGSRTSEWTIFDKTITIHEGDEISTELGTVVYISLFDGSTLEVTERSHIRFSRLRASRFSDASQQVQIELISGSVYGAMAPIVDRKYGEIEVVTATARAIVKADRLSTTNPSPTFVVEVNTRGVPAAIPYRAAAFRGTLEVRSERDSAMLIGPEQVTIDASGVLTPSDTIRSEMIVNGSFDNNLEGWETTYSAEGREPRERVGRTESVIVDDERAETALHIHRGDSTIWARTGVRQAIDRTLRLPAALTLTFDVRIEYQGPSVDGRSTVPIGIQLDYTDILGQDRTWTSSYVLRRDEGIVDSNSTALVTPDEWTKVIIDLENLEPIPRVLGTIVVYASGGGYESNIANLSLTTGEGVANP